MLLDILLLALFVERIGHLAASKGRRPWIYRIVSLVICASAWFLGVVVAGIGIAIHAKATNTPVDSTVYVFPSSIFVLFCILVAGVAFWFVVKGLPETENAPGEKYLSIEFPCTECGERISFKRHHAGLMVNCPKCKKKVIIPEESVPMEPPQLPEDKKIAEQGDGG